MSGGVDSSVAAALLHQRGYEVVGMTLQCWSADGGSTSTAVEDARRVCEQLGIPHVVVDVREEFYTTVVAAFIAAYRAGRTPNPCTLCNPRMKFAVLQSVAQAHEAMHFATGHYTQVAFHEDMQRWCIRRGVNRGKDQSYALYGLTQEQLAQATFPLGTMDKAQVRTLATALGMRVADKPDSQDICFIPGGDYWQFLRQHAPDVVQPGPIVDQEGHLLGTHAGIAFHTIGQRRGLGIAVNAPRFVVRIDAAANTVVVGESEALLRRNVTAADVVFGKFSPAMLAAPQRVTAMLRYRMAPQPAMASLDDAGYLQVEFDTPQRAVTPGQALVCYDGDDVAVGGTIGA
jgi:tRNA-specific 2-thiouridylase